MLATNHGMIVRKRVVYVHVLEKTPDVCLEEAFDLFEVEFRVYKDSSDIGFDNVGKALKLPEHNIHGHILILSSYLGRIFNCSPIILATIRFVLQLFKLNHKFAV